MPAADSVLSVSLNSYNSTEEWDREEEAPQQE